MYYAQVFIRNANDCFTWHSELPVNLGDRVLVSFRNQKKLGITVRVSVEKPDFKTLPILAVYDDRFIDARYIELAHKVASLNLSSVEKVLSLMIPAKFLLEKTPAKRTVFYKLEQPEARVKGVKQQWVLDYLTQAGGVATASDLRVGVALSTLKGLEERNIISASDGLLKTNLKEDVLPSKPQYKLTVPQADCLNEINKSDRPNLLWGVTGSGKTEIYKHLAIKSLKEGKQTLLLLPEIALTSQLIAEFRNIFGPALAVWHSSLSVGEKVQAWERVRTGEAKILIGARSALLVPMPELGLIILDEEHEWTYKNEAGVRFWTHDIAVLLSEHFEARLIFGSATPKLESLQMTKTGTWNLVRLEEQVIVSQAPEMQLVDMSQETKRGNYSPVSSHLQEAITRTLEANRQVVLFLNKRGFAGATMCRHCGERFECPNCSGNMKVHGQKKPYLMCHVCGHFEGFPKSCPSCQETDFKFQGWGTEQVEAWFKKNFPERTILRADRDSVSGRHDFEYIMQKFYHHEADVLLGTQMVAKGLDFQKVDLVGIILADVGLSLPDFRSEERVFQLLTQVAGRTGRREKRGKIIVQTFRPDEPLFSFLQSQQTEAFLESQLKQRALHSWPPFAELAKITFSDESKATAFADTKNTFSALEQIIKERSLDVEMFWVPAFFPKAHNKYWFHIIIKTKDLVVAQELITSIVLPKTARLDIKPSSLL